jgi:hypothetical protein
MKTPQDWNWEHTQICANDPAVHGQLLPTPQMVKFLTRVQADARCDGMEAAIDIYQAACSVMRNRDNENSWQNLQNAAARWNAASQAANNDRIASNESSSATSGGQGVTNANKP